MKISLITFSRAKNYGGILQAYALYQYMESLGHDVQFIDYIMARSNVYAPAKFIECATSKSKLWGSNPLMKFIWKQLYFPKIKSDYLKFSKFIERDCKFTERYFSEEELEQNSPESDIFVVGSDQVWNSEYSPNQNLELPFYLPFTNGKKISYASSFGKNTVPESHKSELTRLLQDFSSISVREESGKKILSELGLDATTVLDPTLLFKEDFWSQKCRSIEKDAPYLLLYQVRYSGEIYTVAKQLAKRLGYKVIVVTMNRLDKQYSSNEVIMTPDVELWLSYIKNADLVYTDSFHATVFSILFHKQCVVNSASRKGMASRISNLLELAHLSYLEMTDYDIKTAEKIASSEIDWVDVDEAIEIERCASQLWLKMALE